MIEGDRDNNTLNQGSIYTEFKIRSSFNEVMASIFISVRYMFGITIAFLKLSNVTKLWAYSKVL